VIRRVRPHLMKVDSVRAVLECNKIPVPGPIFLIEDKAMFFTLIGVGRRVLIVFAEDKIMAAGNPRYLIQDKEGNVRPDDKPSRAPEEVSFPVVRVKYQDLIPEW